MDKTTQFLNNYRAFKRQAQELQVTNEEVLNLFAIYLKNERSQRMQGERKPEEASQGQTKSELATEKQRNYLKSICEERDIRLDEAYLNSLTKQQASELIETYIGEGAG